MDVVAAGAWLIVAVLVIVVLVTEMWYRLAHADQTHREKHGRTETPHTSAR